MEAEIKKLSRKARGEDSDDEHAKNNLPDALARWRERTGAELERAPTEQIFCIPRADIVANGYDLSINRYQELVHDDVGAECQAGRGSEAPPAEGGRVPILQGLPGLPTPSGTAGRAHQELRLARRRRHAGQRRRQSWRDVRARRGHSRDRVGAGRGRVPGGGLRARHADELTVRCTRPACPTRAAGQHLPRTPLVQA